MLVLENAVQDQELLAAAMGVGREVAVRRIAHDRGRARHFIADAVQHAPVDSGDRRWPPVEPRRMNRDPPRKVGVQFHGLNSIGWT